MESKRGDRFKVNRYRTWEQKKLDHRQARKEALFEKRKEFTNPHLWIKTFTIQQDNCDTLFLKDEYKKQYEFPSTSSMLSLVLGNMFALELLEDDIWFCRFVRPYLNDLFDLSVTLLEKKRLLEQVDYICEHFSTRNQEIFDCFHSIRIKYRKGAELHQDIGAEITHLLPFWCPKQSIEYLYNHYLNIVEKPKSLQDFLKHNSTIVIFGIYRIRNLYEKSDDDNCQVGSWLLNQMWERLKEDDDE